MPEKEIDQSPEVTPPTPEIDLFTLERGPKYFQAFKQVLLKTLPDYVHIEEQIDPDNHEGTIFASTLPDSTGNVNIIRAKFEPSQRFVISYSENIQNIDELDDETYNNTDPTRVPFPAITPPYSGWRDEDASFAIQKAKDHMTGIPLEEAGAEEFYNQLVGLRDGQKITMRDYILVYHDQLAKRLGIHIQKDGKEIEPKNEAYRRVTSGSKDRQDEYKELAIKRLSTTSQPQIIDGIEFDSNRLVQEIENETELGTRAIWHEVFKIDRLESSLYILAEGLPKLNQGFIDEEDLDFDDLDE